MFALLYVYIWCHLLSLGLAGTDVDLFLPSSLNAGWALACEDYDSAASL